MKFLIWCCPKSPFEWRAVLVGGSLFFFWVVSEVVAHFTLGSHPEIYRASERLISLFLFFFPNSLYMLLLPLIGNTFIVHAIVGCTSFLVFTLIGKYLSANYTRTKVIRLGILYLVVCFGSFTLFLYLFLRFFFLQPSPFKDFEFFGL